MIRCGKLLAIYRMSFEAHNQAVLRPYLCAKHIGRDFPILVWSQSSLSCIVQVLVYDKNNCFFI